MKPKRIITVLLSIFVLSTLAGCSGDSKDSSEGWLISSRGIGPYELGQTIDKSLLGTNGEWGGCSFAYLPSDVNGVIGMVDENNMWWQPGEEPDSLAITTVVNFLRSDFPNTSTPATSPARTAEGVGPGSTRGEVQAAYPDATVSLGGYGGGYESLLITRDGVPILFTFGVEEATSDDVVEMVFVGLDRERGEWFCA